MMMIMMMLHLFILWLCWHTYIRSGFPLRMLLLQCNEVYHSHRAEIEIDLIESEISLILKMFLIDEGNVFCDFLSLLLQDFSHCNNRMEKVWACLQLSIIWIFLCPRFLCIPSAYSSNQSRIIHHTARHPFIIFNHHQLLFNEPSYIFYVTNKMSPARIWKALTV